ncbi:LL-diaminopimelate aminotransferase [Candidatus Margulisiibacteriota bacterium]
MKKAKRLKSVPPYLFAEIDKKKEAALAKGVDIISLGIGDPDKPTFPNIVEKMKLAVADPKNHDYPPYAGTKEFRKAACDFYKKRFGVAFDPDKNVVSVLGSKEGIAHSFLAFTDPGDIVLVPDPAYPVYSVWSKFVDAIPHYMPLKAENGFLPELKAIPEKAAKKATMLWINYPNNPTGAVAPKEFYQEVVAFCKKYDILLCSDLAYAEMAFDGYKPISIFEAEGAQDIAIEFYSLSKGFNMTGWRSGFVVGNEEAIKTFSIIKTNTDSGIFKAIQEVSVEALSGSDKYISKQNDTVLKMRRDALISGLNSLGWELSAPKATFYIWAPVPKGYTSMQFCSEVLEKCGIIIVPGNGYGQSGEGYFRAAITVEEKRIKEAIERLKKASIKYTK